MRRAAVSYRTPMSAEEGRQIAADCLPDLDQAIRAAETTWNAPSRVMVNAKLRDRLRRLFFEPGRALLPASSAAERVLGTGGQVTVEDLRAIRGALHTLVA